MKKFTSEAMMIPMSPMNMNPPREVKSRFVVQPNMLHAMKVPAQIKKVEVIVELVYAINTTDSVAPFNAAYKTNRAVAVDAFIL